jgi:hypothetical protein
VNALILPPAQQRPLEGDFFGRAWYLYFVTLQQYASTGAGLAQYGTRTARLALDVSGLVDATLYFETDTKLVYQWRGASLAWSYVAGIYARTQAQLAAVAATLKASDAGLLLNVTDYGHILQWTGAAWSWGPGEQGSGMSIPFTVAPTGAGWHLANGAVGVSYLKSDGTTGTTTVANVAGSYFRQ